MSCMSWIRSISNRNQSKSYSWSSHLLSHAAWEVGDIDIRRVWIRQSLETSIEGFLVWRTVSHRSSGEAKGYSRKTNSLHEQSQPRTSDQQGHECSSRPLAWTRNERIHTFGQKLALYSLSGVKREIYPLQVPCSVSMMALCETTAPNLHVIS